jgi:hypothetical protein
MNRAEARAHPLAERQPTCPNPECGSHDIREWCLVPTPYDVESINPDGDCIYGSTGEAATDGATVDEYRCRDCDHSSDDILDFYPWASEQERAEAMVGQAVEFLAERRRMVGVCEGIGKLSTGYYLEVKGRSFILNPNLRDCKRALEDVDELRGLFAAAKAIDAAEGQGRR